MVNSRKMRLLEKLSGNILVESSDEALVFDLSYIFLYFQYLSLDHFISLVFFLGLFSLFYFLWLSWLLFLFFWFLFGLWFHFYGWFFTFPTMYINRNLFWLIDFSSQFKHVFSFINFIYYLQVDLTLFVWFTWLVFSPTASTAEYK